MHFFVRKINQAQTLCDVFENERIWNKSHLLIELIILHCLILQNLRAIIFLHWRNRELSRDMKEK